MLIDMWDTILSDLDKGLAASCLVNLDFEKAFNRLDHDACLVALREHNASDLSVDLVHAFLRDRTMTVRVGETLSSPRPVHGGSPQGSMLGNLLFTITTDKITERIDYAKQILNLARLEKNTEIISLDTSLARIVTDQHSIYGIDNITVTSDSVNSSERGTISFEHNGRECTPDREEPDLDYIRHSDFIQSTPTQKGKFARFVPPGNIITGCLNDTFSSTTGLTFVYMQGHQKCNIITDSTDECLRSALLLSNTNPEIDITYDEPPGWAAHSDMIPFVYIDDTNGSERLLLKNAVQTNTTSNQKLEIHARSCEAFFKGVRETSSKIGMKFYAGKTQLLCISAADLPAVQAYIRLDGEKVESTAQLKICGYNFGSRPGVHEQVKAMECKFNKRCWILRNLKHSGFSSSDLLTTYATLIRPIFDFAAIMYHSLLSGDQTFALERLQKRAFKIIDNNYGTYDSSLKKIGLTTLADRRLSLIDGFLRKATSSERFSEKWFPKKPVHGYETRHEQIYREFKYNTERARNGPLSFFRRRLNTNI